MMNYLDIIVSNVQAKSQIVNKTWAELIKEETAKITLKKEGGKFEIHNSRLTTR